MEISNKRQEELNILLNNLVESGIAYEEANKFIQNNIEILTSKDMNVNDSIYFILNNQDIYGIIFVDEDTYYWSNYINGTLTNLKTLMGEEDVNINTSDFIVDMVINFANTAKMRKIIPAIENYSIENKLKALKAVGLNQNGYHLK